MPLHSAHLGMRPFTAPTLCPEGVPSSDILDDAKEIGFLSTDPGIVITGSLKKQFSIHDEQ